jgi:phosphoglycerate kinase
MTKLTLKDLSLQNQRVLMRVDFNVPLNEDGSIADDSRIRAALPSIHFLLDQNPTRLILMSHLGRPKGKLNAKESLAPCAKRLSELLQMPVAMAPDCIGPSVDDLLAQTPKGSIVMLENLRFHPGEEDPQKEPGFVENLASLGDVYVNDAFGTAHRAHASTALIASHFPGKAAMGFLIETELAHLAPLLHNPKRPYCAITGGSKVSSKVGVLKNLLPKLDALYIGGGMAFPFLKAQSISIGSSLCDASDIPLAQEILAEAEKRSLPIYLPIDTAAAKEGEKSEIFSGDIPDGWVGMDIGPKTTLTWKKSLANAATVFWNGPVGVFEKPPFDRSTEDLAHFLAEGNASVIVGGGDSVAAIQRLGLGDRFAYLSTGGGASLEFLEFGHLPGIDALSDK